MMIRYAHAYSLRWRSFAVFGVAAARKLARAMLRLSSKYSLSVVFSISTVLLVVVVVYYKDATKSEVSTFLYFVAEVGTPNATRCETGTPCEYVDRVDLRVIVITYNRPKSLQKLLRSLDDLELDGSSAALEIWIDRDRKSGNVNKQTLEAASAFTWKGGPVRVHVQVRAKCRGLLVRPVGIPEERLS